MNKNLLNFILQWINSTVALWITSVLFEGFIFSSTESLLLSSVLLTFINIFIKPIVLLLALPFAIVTLGLFVPLLNGAFLMLIASIISDFQIESYWISVFSGLLISIISFLINISLGNTRSSLVYKKFSRNQERWESNPTNKENYKEDITIDVKVREKDK